MSEGGQTDPVAPAPVSEELHHKRDFLAAHPEVSDEPVVVAEPVDPRSQPDRENEAAPGDAFKAEVRANARWIMAEIQLAQAGLTADERAAANP